MQRLEVSGAVRPLYGSLGVKGLRSTKKSLPPPQHTCSCQQYRRQIRMSTQPKQQTGVTFSPHHRQENTAPQGQTRAQAMCTPLAWNDSARTLYCHRQTGKHMLYTRFFTICTHTPTNFVYTRYPLNYTNTHNCSVLYHIYIASLINCIQPDNGHSSNGRNM